MNKTLLFMELENQLNLIWLSKSNTNFLIPSKPKSPANRTILLQKGVTASFTVIGTPPSAGTGAFRRDHSEHRQ